MKRGPKKNETPTLRQQHFVEYQAWINMLHRCHNPKCYSFKEYGARGIAVSAEWRSYETGFAQFIADMGSRPSSLHSIERNDNFLGYSKQNCSWELRKVQQNNRRKSRYKQLDYGLGFDRRSPMIEHQGQIKSLKTWADEFAIKSTTLRQRLKRGMDIAAALNPKNLRYGVGHKRVIRQITIN